MPSVAAVATAETGSDDDEPADPAADDMVTPPSPVFAFLEGDLRTAAINSV